MAYRLSKIELVIGLVLFIGAALCWVIYNSNFQASSPREIFSKEIKRSGGEAAYEQFKQRKFLEPTHTLTHVFGEELFLNLGTEGVGICDDSFEFGCYHGFFTAGLAKNDLNLIYEFKEACIKKWGDKSLPCEHGLGHGLMSETDSLNEALDWCGKISEDNIGGCVSGVFMEYNFPTLVDHSGTRPRILENDPIAPCESINEDYKTGCYFGLPQWWLAIYGNNFSEVEEACNQIDNNKNRQWCFHGMGIHVAPIRGFQAEATIKVCNDLSTSIVRQWCKEGASWVLISRPNANPEVICEGSKECLQKIQQNPFYEN